MPDVALKFAFRHGHCPQWVHIRFDCCHLRVVVSWEQGTLAVNRVNDLLDHLDDHWVGVGGQSDLDHEACRITIEGEDTWGTWTRKR